MNGPQPMVRFVGSDIPRRRRDDSGLLREGRDGTPDGGAEGSNPSRSTTITLPTAIRKSGGEP